MPSGPITRSVMGSFQACIWLSSLGPDSLRQRTDDQAAIMAAEAEAVGDGPPDRHLACGIGHVVQVAGGVRRLKVDGGMDHTVTDREERGDELDPPAGPKEMADHALGAAYRELTSVCAEDSL